MAAAVTSVSKTKTPIKQNDLRRLMKERREKGGNQEKKIDSPLAKYNNLGQLFCTVCNIQIKKEALWSSHIVNKTHKNALDTLKSKKLSNKTSDLSSDKKRESSTSLEDVNLKIKNAKLDDTPLPKEIRNDLKNLKEKDPKAVLPADFFDTSLPPETETETAPETSVEEEPKTSPIPSTSAKSEIPEGFFDDPKQDAKARKVEYKDPMDEEWEKFQKTINEETNVSQAIIDEDVLESKVERDIDEIDEQIHNWARVEALQNRRETFSTSAALSEKNSDDSGTSGDEDLDEFLNWRSKGALRR